ncbi:MAG: 1-acyl-sn-glycerol-3-phosphate acyltransferase (EC [uncultured Campylobacterales bacterium]|uniref:1-acyl-sn-glycerol-3-phosphate acyltransferase (EC) n=1 Tax=uncultured Campylobacterales bacterium TaxID=352960 RepID=A0A6S6SIY3_9BACT|nr:MAG: 1-acyl-sn-glycerol-3-phosphate acyltransferase (EC [uncultured Campylobacterales bacterium]
MKILLKLKAFSILINFLSTVFILILFMKLFPKSNSKARIIWSKFQVWFMGIKINKISQIDESADVLFINHQSLLDIPIIESVQNRNTAWVAKKEIADIFFYGHILKVPKMIILDRSKPKLALKTLLAEGKKAVDDKRVICIFPEGTRGEGDEVGEFKIGAKFLAAKHNLKVQPIVLTNTIRIIDSKKFEARRGSVTMKFLDSFYPKDLGEDWYEQVNTQMKNEYKNMMKEEV